MSTLSFQFEDCNKPIHDTCDQNPGSCLFVYMFMSSYVSIWANRLIHSSCFANFNTPLNSTKKTSVDFGIALIL